MIRFDFWSQVSCIIILLLGDSAEVKRIWIPSAIMWLLSTLHWFFDLDSET